MDVGEKLGLAAILLTLLGMFGGTIAFIGTTEIKDLQFHIKLIYVFMAFLAFAIGILYFISFTSEKKKEGESK